MRALDPRLLRRAAAVRRLLALDVVAARPALIRIEDDNLVD
jgi:hypothetical protein